MRRLKKTNFGVQDGYIFRLRISNSHEMSAIKRQIDDTGEVKYCDTVESEYLENTLVQLPALTSAIHGYSITDSIAIS